MSALAGIAACSDRAAHPIVVLDVDLTLIENAARTRSLMVDFVCAQASGGALAEAEREALVERALTMPLVFSIRDNVAALGLDPMHHKALLSYWREAFFDPRRLVHDTALPGAVDAVQALSAAGATVVYLTARLATMAAATVEHMARLGFPIAVPGAVLVTKPDPAMRDEAYKTQALGWIARLGEVVLCADNEPSHCNAMHAAFPDALTVMVTTRHSEPAPPLAPRVVRVGALAEAL